MTTPTEPTGQRRGLPGSCPQRPCGALWPPRVIKSLITERVAMKWPRSPRPPRGPGLGTHDRIRPAQAPLPLPRGPGRRSSPGPWSRLTLPTPLSLLPLWSSAPPSGPGWENQWVCPLAASLPCGSRLASPPEVPGPAGTLGRSGGTCGGSLERPPGAGLPWKAGVSCPRPGRQAGACLLAWEADASADSSPGAGGGRAGAAAGAAPRLPPRSLPRPAGREAPSGLPVSRARFSQASRAHGRGLGADPGGSQLAVSWARPGLGEGWPPGRSPGKQ